MPNIAESAVPYAILALYDADVEITEDNLSKILTAAGVEVEPVWLSVFCKALDKAAVKNILCSFEAGAATAAPVAAAGAAQPAGKSAAAPAAAKKEEPEEEEEMSLSLFD